MPEGIKHWFITAPDEARLGKSKSLGKARGDRYLRASQGSHLGAKLREGKVEVKLLDASEDLAAKDGAIKGKGEGWIKWSWRYTCEKRPSGKKLDDELVTGLSEWTDDTLHVTLWKRRTERRFIEGKNGTLEPTEERIKTGLKAEVTELEIGKKKDKWWTIAIEVVGDTEDPFSTLRRGIASILAEYPDSGPALQRDHSMSYPEWIKKSFTNK